MRLGRTLKICNIATRAGAAHQPRSSGGRSLDDNFSRDGLALLTRIAEALERLAPSPPPAPLFDAAVLFRADPATGRIEAAPDFGLPLDLLLGIDRQKAKMMQNLK